MTTIYNERVIAVDIDDTLVMHNLTELCPLSDRVNVVDPMDSSQAIQLRINNNMVRLVKEEFERGSTIIVWSRGGYQWALNVLEALNMQDIPLVVMTKPITYFDDTPVEKWMKDRVYIGPDEAYKKNIVTLNRKETDNGL